MSRASLRGAVTATVVALVAAALAGLSVSLYLGVAEALWAQRDRALVGRARTFAALVEHDDEDGFEMERPVVDGAAWQVWLPDGQTLARSASLGSADLPAAAGTFEAPVFDDVVLPDGNSARRIGVRFVPRNEGDAAVGPVVLALAETSDDVVATLAAIRSWFWMAGAITLAIVGATTAWVVARGLRPLARLAGELSRIDDSRLSARLPEGGQPEELVAPVRKLNQLLARLEESFARERRFTADVSHELRTPLAGLRTLLEVTGRKQRGPEEYREALADALGIALQLAALVENLLALARLDSGHVELARTDVELAALVEDCWRIHAPRAAARGLRFDNRIPRDARIHTDRESLRLVVGELLANAVEYTTEGGWVEAAQPAGALLAVADSGPGIPAEELDRIFERFWRGATGRPVGGGHCGIGLSLVRGMCARLGLRVRAVNRSEGGVAFLLES